MASNPPIVIPANIRRLLFLSIAARGEIEGHCEGDGYMIRASNSDDARTAWIWRSRAGASGNCQSFYNGETGRNLLSESTDYQASIKDVTARMKETTNAK